MTPESRPPLPADAESAESPAGPAAVIRAEIESNPDRRITFARFMERALYEPDFGYYTRPEDRPTDAGDFLTAPETHPIFGWTVARRIERIWVELGRPRPFDLIEYGAGSGTLALSILEGFRRHAAAGITAAGLLDAVRYEPIESNPHRLSDLHDRFENAGLAGLLATSSAGSTTVGASASEGIVPVTGVILANEFLDALPVHRLVVRGGRLLELFVTWRDGFVEVPAEPSPELVPQYAERLADDGIVPGMLAEGQVLEICLGLAPWLDEVSRRLARGSVIVIDYGYQAAELYGPRHLAGTLLGYRGHRVQTDPFADVGQTDLTAHVDFTALEFLGERRGLRSVSLTTQSEFLVAAGLEAELQTLQASPDLTAPDYMRARSAIVRMLDPRHMGRFRVLTLARDVP